MIAKPRAVMQAGSHANCKSGKNLTRSSAPLFTRMILILSSTCMQYITQCSYEGSFPDTWYFLVISLQIDDSALMQSEPNWQLTWSQRRQLLKPRPMTPGGRIKKLGQHERWQDPVRHQSRCHQQNAVVANKSKISVITYILCSARISALYDHLQSVFATRIMPEHSLISLTIVSMQLLRIYKFILVTWLSSPLLPLNLDCSHHCQCPRKVEGVRNVCRRHIPDADIEKIIPQGLHNTIVTRVINWNWHFAQLL